MIKWYICFIKKSNVHIYLLLLSYLIHLLDPLLRMDVKSGSKSC